MQLNNFFLVKIFTREIKASCVDIIRSKLKQNSYLEYIMWDFYHTNELPAHALSYILKLKEINEKCWQEPHPATRNIDCVLSNRTASSTRFAFFSSFSFFFYPPSFLRPLSLFLIPLYHSLPPCCIPPSASHPHEPTIHTIGPFPDVHVVYTSKKAIC